MNFFKAIEGHCAFILIAYAVSYLHNYICSRRDMWYKKQDVYVYKTQMRQAVYGTVIPDKHNPSLSIYKRFHIPTPTVLQSKGNKTK